MTITAFLDRSFFEDRSLHHHLHRMQITQIIYFDHLKDLLKKSWDNEAPRLIVEKKFRGDIETFLKRKHPLRSSVAVQPRAIKDISNDQNIYGVKENPLQLFKIFEETRLDYVDCFVSTGMSLLYRTELSSFIRGEFDSFTPYFSNKTKGSHRAFFLDRDGIINVDSGYIGDSSKIFFYEDVFKLLRLAQNNDYKIIVLSNQSGVAYEYFSFQDVLRLHEWMDTVMKQHGIIIDRWCFSPHRIGTPGDYSFISYYRKPFPSMAIEAADDLGIDLSSSFMLGDKITDKLYIDRLQMYGIRRNHSLDGLDPRCIFDNLKSFTDFFKNLHRS